MKIKTFKSLIISAALISCLSSVAFADETGLSSSLALDKLKIGNEKFVKGNLEHPDQTILRRSELLKGQQPFAVILTCSDSRVPPEMIFDQGLGNIFVIRNAGNIADNHVIGSVEYAVEHLGTQLLVVMGHQNVELSKLLWIKQKEVNIFLI